jgi:hypothetical protein
MTGRPVRLFTSSYRAFDPSFGVPVQTSNGRPKWPVPYDLRHSAPILYPAWSLVADKSLSADAFRAAYWAGLDRRGIERIADALVDIALTAGDDRLVLMCFEADPADCHRADFAQWWTRQTGEDVPELPR